MNRCLHGSLNDGSPEYATTLFPASISTSRSFSPTLVHSIAEAISIETRAKANTAMRNGQSANYPNGLICWAPMVNLCRDPRWGRCQEGFGEDPFLQATFASVYVTGMQEGPDSKYVRAAATCKHFDVHGYGNIHFITQID